MSRVVTLVVSLVIAGAIIWRGHTYVDAGGGMGVLTPLMCSVFAVFIFLTGVALACRDREAEAAE